MNARIDQETLEALKRILPAQDLAHAIRWLAANATTRDLFKSITHSTERISELVRAVKSYSFLDRAPWQEIDVHEGIENTLIILGIAQERHRHARLRSHPSAPVRLRRRAKPSVD